MESGQRWIKGMWLLKSPWIAMPMVSPFTSNRRWLKTGVNWIGTELGLSLCWQISLSGSVSASLYCTYTMQFMAILGDMGIFSLTKSSEWLAYDSIFSKFEILYKMFQNALNRHWGYVYFTFAYFMLHVSFLCFNLLIINTFERWNIRLLCFTFSFNVSV